MKLAGVTSMKPINDRTKLKGFTLIELVAVVLILAILSVLALPKYVSVESEANTRVITNLKSTIEASVKHYHLKATIDNSGSTIANGFTYQGVYFDQGYPLGISYGDNDGIPEILETIALDKSIVYASEVFDWTSTGKSARGLYLTNVIESSAEPTVLQIKATNCYLVYKSHVREPIAPEITTVTSNC